MAPSHILQIFLRITIQNQIRISQWVSSSTQPVSMLNLQILSSYFMCDFCDTSLLIRFWTHSGWKSTFILLSEENKKSEPFSYREKVRIFYFSGSPPGRHSYGLGTAHEQKPHRGFCCPACGGAVLFKSSYPRLLLKGNCRVKQKRQLSKAVSLVVQ